MKIHATLSTAILSFVLLCATGCAVQRGQESLGAYVDDSAITAMVKSSLIADKLVNATSIRVETLKGTVTLSGFSKTASERGAAGAIARGVKGVTHVKNDILIRP